MTSTLYFNMVELNKEKEVSEWIYGKINLIDQQAFDNKEKPGTNWKGAFIILPMKTYFCYV